MPAVDAMRLLGEELVLDGIPLRNLATFVTTWMEPEAQRVIAENLHRNYIDHAEYPQTAEIEQRCIRMLADLYHAPGETTGTRTQGSSEAIMLGALSLKWKWRARREAAGQGDRPAEPRLRRRRARRVGEVLPLLRRRAADHPAAAAQVHDRPRGRRAASSTRTRSASPRCSARRSPGTPTTSSGSTTCSCACATSRASTSRCTSTAPAAASCGRSSTPTRRGTSASSACARSTCPVTSTGSCTRGSAGWSSASASDLPEDLVFYENYLGKRDATFTLNFSTGAAHGARPVLQLRPLRARRLPLHHGDDAGQRPRARRADHRQRATSSSSATPAPSSFRSSPSSSPRSATSTSSTSPRSSPPSAAGWCPPTRCRRTPST